MNADLLFTVSVIDGATLIQAHRRKYNNPSVADAVRQLLRGPASLASYDYERAQILAGMVGWDAFGLEGSRQDQLCETLKRLVFILQPFWARSSYLGRARVLRVVNGDQAQLLRYAGLLDQTMSPAAIRWWQDVGQFFRSVEDKRKLDIGRQGEQLTLARETAMVSQLGIDQLPRLVSVEDNTAGYDVLSYTKGSDGVVRELRIEVKACAYSPTHFFLTRQEWETAKQYGDHYRFDVWNLETGVLVQLSVEEMSAHVPGDRGLGQWQALNITFGSHPDVLTLEQYVSSASSVG